MLMSTADASAPPGGRAQVRCDCFASLALIHCTGSIPDVLQEPLRRNLPAHLALHRLLENPAADGGELQALVADVAVERDLVARRAAGALARHQVGEIRLVAAAAAVAELGAVAAHAGLRV